MECKLTEGAYILITSHYLYWNLSYGRPKKVNYDVNARLQRKTWDNILNMELFFKHGIVLVLISFNDKERDCVGKIEFAQGLYNVNH